MAVICSRYKFVTVSLLKQLRSLTAVSLLKPPSGSRSGLKYPLRLLESSTVDIIVFKDVCDGRGYRNMCKTPEGPIFDLGHLYSYCTAPHCATTTAYPRSAEPKAKASVPTSDFRSHRPPVGNLLQRLVYSTAVGLWLWRL